MIRRKEVKNQTMYTFKFRAMQEVIINKLKENGPFLKVIY